MRADLMDISLEKGIESMPIHATKLGTSGDVILMMHGWGQTSDSMRLLGDLLSKWYQVYLIDLPGFGKTAKPAHDWDTVQYAQRLASYIDELKLAKVHLLGHSFGGRVAIRMASRFPEKVASVILINSGGLKRTAQGKKKFRALSSKWLGKTCKGLDSLFGTATYKDWFVPTYGSRDYLAAGEMRNILVKAVNEDASEDAAKIQAPTFLLWGELDDETPVEFGRRFHTLIKNSRLVVLPGKNHFPFIDEGAHLCGSYILKFLADVVPTGSERGAGSA
jgi:pimeloyl-ACP methyl ester carboxylesterase